MVYSILVYSGLIAVIIGCNFFGKLKNKKLGFFLSMAIPCFCVYLLLCLKTDSVGTDTITYKRWFAIIANNEKTWSSFGQDYGYYFLIFLFSRLTSSFRAFQFFYYFLCMACFLFFCLSFFKRNNWGLLLFLITSYFPMAFSGLRQFGAECFCLLSLALWLKKGRLSYKILSLLTWLIACTFHSSAFVFAFVFLFSFAKLKKESFLPLIAIYFFVFINAGIINYCFNSVYSFNYSVSSVFLGFPFRSLIFFLFFLFCFTFLFFSDSTFLKNGKLSLLEDVKINKENNVALLSLLFSAIIYSFSSVSDIMTRFSFYFEFSLMTLPPQIFDRFENKKVRAVACISLFAFAVAYFFYSILVSPMHVSKYSFFFLEGGL